MVLGFCIERESCWTPPMAAQGKNKKERKEGQSNTHVAPIADEHNLRILAVLVIDLAVAGLHRLAHARVVELGPGDRPRELVHAGDQIREVVPHHEVLAVLLEVLHGDRALGTEDAADEELPQALARQVRVLLRSGERELPRDDGLVQDEPRVIVARAADVLQRRERVASGVEEGGQPLACCVEPERRRRGEHANAVAWPDWVPVLQAFCVMPHCSTRGLVFAIRAYHVCGDFGTVRRPQNIHSRDLDESICAV